MFGSCPISISGGERDFGGCRNGQDVVVRRDMEVTKVVEEVKMDKTSG